MANAHIHIGTSGWNYDDWIGRFYPGDIKNHELLSEYAKTFSTVELNNSHYQLPKPDAVQDWVDQSPSSFIFSCKAHRYITHAKKLTDPEEGLGLMMDALRPLGNKLGPILFQLPGRWKVNRERLTSYLQALPKGYRYAFEFRDTSWLCRDVYGLLREHQVALCFYDYKGYRSPEEITADFVYIRLHGPNQAAYTGSYDGRTLAAYARKIKTWSESGMDVYCYFDNDQNGCAPADARDLLAKLG